METDTEYIGDEDLNKEATALLDSLLGDDETLAAVAGFDFETKVIAITDLRVIITSGNDGLVLNVRHNHISTIRRDGRTLEIRTTTGVEHRHRFGKDETVQRLVEIAWRERRSQSSRISGSGQSSERQPAQENRVDGNTPSIAERVKFWEEQDQINQELIPRVIRQHELISKHISDHEMLPVVAAAAAREAVEQAQGETLRQLEEARTQNQELVRQLEESKALAERQSQELQDAKAEREKLSKDLEETKSERERLSQELQVVIGEREVLTGAVEGAEREREAQKKQHEEELSDLKGSSRMFKVLTSAACAAAVAAIVVAIIL